MRKFGDKVKTKKMSFLFDDNLYTAYYPLIEVNGQFVTIRNDDYQTKMVNAPTRYKAKKLGEEMVSKLKSEQRGEL